MVITACLQASLYHHVYLHSQEKLHAAAYSSKNTELVGVPCPLKMDALMKESAVPEVAIPA